MRNRHRLGIVIVLGILGIGTVILVAMLRSARSSAVTADVMVVAAQIELTGSATPAPFTSATPIPSTTPSLTATATATITSTTTPTLTSTNTLSTLVLQVTSVNADVMTTPILASFPAHSEKTLTAIPTVSVPTPQANLSPIPSKADEQGSAVGWVYTSVDNPVVRRVGQWEMYTQTYRATDRRYLFTDDKNARLIYRFLGAAIRVRYVGFHTYGVFQILIDGQIRATIDSYQSEHDYPFGNFLSTEVYGLSHGWHTLEILCTGRKAPISHGTFIAIDAIDVYLNGPEPTLPSPMMMNSSTPVAIASPRPAVSISIVAAPPTIGPTITAGPPAITSIDFSAAYDLNNNKNADTVEGIQGLSVRLVRADTNEILVDGFTDADGFVHLEGTSNVPLRLVIPYFGKYWDVPSTRGDVQIRLIIPAANQPGLIP